MQYIRQELKRYVICELETLAAAIAKLNRVGFQIVVSSTGTLVGALTDGDVRRALLRGAHLHHTSVGEAANLEVTYARDDDLPLEAAQLRGLQQVMAPRPVFVPICNSALQVVAVGVELHAPRVPSQASAPSHDVVVVVMVGGLGTRMGALVHNQPKPLLEVGGEAILTTLLELVSAQLNPKAIYLATWHMSEQFRAYAAQSPLNLSCLQEPTALGTAGALRLLPAEETGTIVLLNGDIRTDANLTELLLFHQQQQSDLTVAFSRFGQQVPYGVISYAADGTMTQIEEKPELSFDICAGIYCLERHVIALIPDKEAYDMPTLVTAALRKSLRVNVFPLFEHWMDLGTPEALTQARSNLQQ